MKHWFCPHCSKRKITEDKIVVKICEACVEMMEEEKEEKGDGQN